MSKQKKIEAYVSQIPSLLKTFKEFLETNELRIEAFKYNEEECDQIESIMRTYFKGNEHEYFVFDDYISSIRTVGKRPAIGKNDIIYDAYSVYIGEFVINNTPCNGYDLGSKKTVLADEITWKFKNMGQWSINSESYIITNIIFNKGEGKSIYQALNHFYQRNNEKI